MLSGQDNLYVLNHNVETGEVTQIVTTEAELNRAVDLELLQRQNDFLAKQNAREAIYKKLNLTADEINLLLG